MSLFKTDPLLAFCRLFSWFILLSMTFSALFSVCAAVAALTNGPFVVKVLRLSYPQMQETELLIPFALGMAFIAAGSALVIRFMLHLLGVIQSVAAAEAFTLANAGRIKAMAWLSLIAMPMGFAIGAALGRVVMLLGPRAEDAGIRIVSFDGGFSYAQILLTLLLFVLARLFAQAAAMRDEIEGTV